MLSKTIFSLFISFLSLVSLAQRSMRSVESLIDNNSGWPIIRKWIDSAKNKVEVLPVDSISAKEALYLTQVSTHGSLGAVVYFTGGILVDNGWIRILGSGNNKLARTLPGWNTGKNFSKSSELPSFYLVADDAVGGFFAINGGRFGKEGLGKIYYLSPDRLEWEALDLTYTEFLLFCFSGDLVKFYGNMRWKDWEKDVLKISSGKVFNFNPPLWSKEGKNMEKNKRKMIPVEEQYQFNIDARKQLKLEKEEYN